MRPTARACSVVLFLLALAFFLGGMAIMSNGGEACGVFAPYTEGQSSPAQPAGCGHGSTAGGVALFGAGAACVGVSTWRNRQRR